MACKISVLQMPSPPAPIPQGEGGERLPPASLLISLTIVGYYSSNCLFRQDINKALVQSLGIKPYWDVTVNA